MLRKLYYYFFKTEGEQLIESFLPYAIGKLDNGMLEFYSRDKRYVFSYDSETDTSEIWQEGDLVYSTECPVESFKLYVDLKCRKNN